MEKREIEIVRDDEEGETREDSVTLLCRWVICDECEGNGRYVNPSIDGNGITQSEFDADPDFRESYFRGDYDIDCGVCRGSGKVMAPVPLETALAFIPAEKRESYRQDFIAWEDSEIIRERWAAYDREDAAIRRMENGGR